ncbi:MAG: 2-oxoacid:acceptor oxidoreductase family protein, partial [Nitrospirota bacterium]|nr:2-oxoacid:acceptor oxidoreductase family protein [Nitrospirota bacterium]
IGSPVVQNPDILISMNRASLERFLPCLKKKGLLFFDSSLVNGVALRNTVTPVGVPATKIADTAGDTKAANMVMLGALIAKTGLLKISSFDILFSFPPVSARNKAAGINKNSLLEGIRYLENKKSCHC